MSELGFKVPATKFLGQRVGTLVESLIRKTMINLLIPILVAQRVILYTTTPPHLGETILMTGNNTGLVIIEK